VSGSGSGPDDDDDDDEDDEDEGSGPDELDEVGRGGDDDVGAAVALEVDANVR
jgi:hypothetical protein